MIYLESHRTVILRGLWFRHPYTNGPLSYLQHGYRPWWSTTNANPTTS